MDKFLKDKRISKVDIQLDLLEKRKKSLLRDLYCSYEIYLSEIRTQIFNSVSTGLFSLAEMTNTRGIVCKDNISLLIKNEIKLLIDQLLPFLTIEQLSILGQLYIQRNENLINDFKNNQFIPEKDLISKYSDEETNFQNDNYYYYYGNNRKYNLNNSVDLDNNNYYKNYVESDISLLNKKEEEQFYTSPNNLLENNNNTHIEFKPFNIFEENQLKSILDWSDLIDIGLSFQLKKISIEVNNIFFRTIFTKEMIPEDLITYFFENSFLSTNPKPFIAKLDLLTNEFLYINEILKNINLSKIYLFYINPTEVEFNNININVHRNNISKLRNHLKELIKKEFYWSNKKLNSNYGTSKVHSN